MCKQHLCTNTLRYSILDVICLDKNTIISSHGTSNVFEIITVKRDYFERECSQILRILTKLRRNHTRKTHGLLLH